MANNIIDDLSTLTTIQKAPLDRLADLSSKIIAHNLYEDLSNKETTSETNIAIGSLLIKVEDNEIMYKFVPSSKFENLIRNTVIDNKSPLTGTIEKSIFEKIEKAYKDLM